MNLDILKESDLDTVLSSESIQTVWQRDPLLKDDVANFATRKYLKNVLKQGDSLGYRKDDSLPILVVGSIPQWDTEFFGFKSYVMRYIHYDEPGNLSMFLESFENWLAKQDIRYTYVKLPGDMTTAIRVLEDQGFSIADLRVTFNRRLQDEFEFPSNTGDLVFDIAQDEDIEDIAEISRLVSKADRFHADPNIPSELADELYYRWVVNGAKSGKDIVKCTVNGKIVGFHMSYPESYLTDNSVSPLSVSDLMGVLPDYGGRGIGSWLFYNYFSLAKTRKCSSVQAGVHLDNIISMRLHEKVGFRAILTEVGLRKWY